MSNADRFFDRLEQRIDQIVLPHLHTHTERILQAMSDYSDAATAQFDSLQTSITNLAGHQAKAFTDLEAAVNNGADKETILALTARAKSFTDDLANLDAAATAADPGAAIVTHPGTPDPVTPATPATTDGTGTDTTTAAVTTSTGGAAAPTDGAGTQAGTTGGAAAGTTGAEAAA